MNRNWSLRSHFAMITVTLVVAVTAVISVVASDRSFDRIVEGTGNGLSQTAADLSNLLENETKSRVSVISSLSRVPGVMDPATASEIAEGLRLSDPALAWLGIMDTKGNVIAATRDMLVGKNIASRPVFSEALKGPYIGDVHEAALLGKMVAPYGFGDDGEVKFVDVSRPILDANNVTTGVIAAHFGWNWARRLVQSATAAAISRKDMEMLIVASDGTVLVGPNGSVGKPVGMPALTVMLATYRTGALIETYGGRNFLVGYATRGPFNWTVIARQPLTVATLPAAALRDEIFLFGLFLAVTFSIAGWVAAGYLARPLHEIAGAAAKMLAGDLGVRIPAMGGSREIETLSANLRSLVDALMTRDAAIVRLKNDVNRDPLTGLTNRRGFERQIAGLTTGAGASPVTLLYIDLDDFKTVNDTMGHATGDVVLRTVASRIGRCLRDKDMAARLGGDEFAAVLVPACSEDEAQAVASRIIASVSAPVTVESGEAKVGCSIGVASWPDGDRTIDQALETADAALYAAKRAGKGRVQMISAKAA